MDSRNSNSIDSASFKHHTNEMYDESMVIGVDDTTDNEESHIEDLDRDNQGHGSIIQRLKSSRGIRPPFDEEESEEDYSYDMNDCNLSRKNSDDLKNFGIENTDKFISKQAIQLSRDEKFLYSNDDDNQNMNRGKTALRRENSSFKKDNYNQNESILSDEEEEGDTEDEESSTVSTPLAGAYNAQDYQHLDVADDVRDLFNCISKYSPQIIDLSCILKPFIPEFIPCIAECDPILKPTRPDNEPSDLGISILDEPSMSQSDPIILEMKLKQLFKLDRIQNSKNNTHSQNVSIKSLDIEDKHTPSAIKNWINNIKDIHSCQPPITVHYTKIMPSVDELLSEWPKDVEGFVFKNENNPENSPVKQNEPKNRNISKTNLLIPPPTTNCTTEQYVDIACPIVDIPVYTKSRIQSLHLLFSLYSSANERFNFYSKNNASSDKPSYSPD